MTAPTAPIRETTVSASSTEPRLPLAWPLAKVTLDELVRTWKLAPAEAKALHGTLATRHTDPAWLARTLDALPVPALALVAILAEDHGSISEGNLYARAAQAYGFDAAVVRRAILTLFQPVLAVALSGPGGERSFALISPPGPALAAAVRDLDLPAVPTGELPRGPADDGRFLLAACAATRHVDIKVTVDGRPHRTAVKRLAKAVGVADDDLDAAVTVAYLLRLLEVDDHEVLRPNVPALCAAAEAQYGGLLQLVVAQLARDRPPRSSAALERWAARIQRGAYADRLELPIRLLGWLPGLRGGTLAGVEVIAAAPATAHAVAASITPSFEVFLPPEAPPKDLVDVLLCCELTRIDRAITGRLTKASVGRAAAAGATPDGILASLAAASRTPVPQNVAAAIRDWAGAPPAVLATGRVVVVPPAEAARVQAALGRACRSVLAPGVFLLDEASSPREVAATLGKLGIVCVAAHGLAPGTPVAHELERADADAYPPLPDPGDAQDRIRQRLAAWHRADPTERARLPPAAVSLAPEGDELADEVVAALEAWEHRSGRRLPDHLFSILASALELAGPAERDRVLRCRELSSLQHELAALAHRGALRAPGHKPPASAPPRAWLAGDPRAAIERALALDQKLALETSSGELVILPTDVVRKGKAWMVLGVNAEDLDVAVPLDQILRVAIVAEPPAPPAVTRPWRPAAGVPPPAGHVPCPCGSGERYRSCCRDAPSA